MTLAEGTLPVKVVATNRKARHEYHLLETFECGLVLLGHEVKSIREGRVNLQEAFAVVENGEAWVEGMHVTPYSHLDTRAVDPLRRRKLLLHKKQVEHLFGKIREKGLALVPLKVYFKGARVKIEIALARGKKLYDRREEIAERDAKREIARASRQGRRDRGD
jgi:SsrA-binding protein